MSQRIRKENVTGATHFYRAPYEGISAIAWFLGALIYVVIARTVHEDISVVGLGAIPMFVIGLYRLYQVNQNWAFKTHLTTPLRPWMTVEMLLRKQRHSGETFLGKGFDWEPYHARLMKEISTISTVAALAPPSIYRRVMTWLGLVSRNTKLEGKHYIHGCGEEEADLFVSDQSRRSHTLVLGTNGAGKTRMLETLVTQSIARGSLTDKQRARRLSLEKLYTNTLRVRTKTFRVRLRASVLRFLLSRIPKENHGPVFILDPKGDPDLRDRAYATAKKFGRDEHFYYFSPTDANSSFRLNPLANFTRRTELANRVTALLPTGGDSDAFKQFAWRAVNVVIEGLHMARIPINLINLRTYVEGGIERLIVPCIRNHMNRHLPHYPDWETTVKGLSNRIPRNASLDDKAVQLAAAMGSYYVENVRPNHPHTTIDGLVDVMMHDSAHYSKLISNLIPILVQLTTGPMETLLSRPKSSIPDARVPTSFGELITKNRIVYINFESLADSVVGSALGSLFIADLTACAARRHHSGISDPPVSIYIDEAAEMMNDPFIQALNKGRSAGFELTLASQTIADFVARMGNEAKALQVLGNVNTTIAMRLQDNDSIQMITEKFSDTSYEEKTSSKTATTIAAMAKRGRDFSGSVMKNSQTSELSLVTADLLSSLPPGHFFGHMPGGRKVKGRVLMMPIEASDRFIALQHGKTAHRYTPTTTEKKTRDESLPPSETDSVVIDPRPDAAFGSDAGLLALPA
jgi:conjugal transfer pilus assembly protein TraD